MGRRRLVPVLVLTSSKVAPGSARELLRDPALAAAVGVAVVVGLGFGLVVPVLPLLARSFGVSLFAVSSLVAVFAGTRLVSNIAAGAVADRIGSRNAIGAGVLIVGVSSALCAVAATFPLLLVVRGAGGFGSALFFNALLSSVVQRVGPDRRGRAVGLLQGAFLFGIGVGPSIGGLLAEPLGLRWPFVVYAGACFASAAVAFRFLPADAAPTMGLRGVSDEPVAAAAPSRRSSSPAAHRRRDAGVWLRDPTFLAALIMMAASRWSAAGVRFSLIPVYAEEVVGVSARVLGVALTLAAATHLLVLGPAGRIADLRGRRALAFPAFLGFAVIAGSVAVATQAWSFLLVMSLYGIGTGFTSIAPAAIVGDIAPPERAGSAIGVLNTFGDLGSVLGPLTSGWLADQAGYGWGFGLAAGLLAVAAGAAFAMRETLPSHVP